MIIKAYSVYDRKAFQYHTPFFAVADGVAMRMVQDLANDASTSIGAHPGDYVLYHVGLYDDSNGLLRSDGPPVHIVDAINLVRHQEQLFPKPAPAPAAPGFDSATRAE